MRGPGTEWLLRHITHALCLYAAQACNQPEESDKSGNLRIKCGLSRGLQPLSWEDSARGLRGGASEVARSSAQTWENSHSEVAIRIGRREEQAFFL